MIGLKFDATEIEKLGEVYARAPKEAPKLIARALNHSGRKAFTRVKRKVAREMGVKQQVAARQMTKRAAYQGRLVFDISGRGRHMTLEHFSPRQTRRGVSAKPWGKRRVFRSTFIMNGKVRKRKTAARFPVKALYGPSLPKEMLRERVTREVDDSVKASLIPRVHHELNRFLSK